MHWAAHGHTAAELIARYVDARTPNMGLTSWAEASKGGAIRRSEASVAKNDLTGRVRTMATWNSASR